MSCIATHAGPDVSRSRADEPCQLDHPLTPLAPGAAGKRGDCARFSPGRRRNAPAATDPARVTRGLSDRRGGRGPPEACDDAIPAPYLAADHSLPATVVAGASLA